MNLLFNELFPKSSLISFEFIKITKLYVLDDNYRNDCTLRTESNLKSLFRESSYLEVELKTKQTFKASKDEVFYIVNGKKRKLFDQEKKVLDGLDIVYEKVCEPVFVNTNVVYLSDTITNGMISGNRMIIDCMIVIKKGKVFIS